MKDKSIYRGECEKCGYLFTGRKTDDFLDTDQGYYVECKKCNRGIHVQKIITPIQYIIVFVLLILYFMVLIFT